MTKTGLLIFQIIVALYVNCTARTHIKEFERLFTFFTHGSQFHLLGGFGAKIFFNTMFYQVD